jgi:nitrite reductase/ring-hydroxylating ferredoxin subunit
VAKPSGPIRATVLTPTVANDNVSIPASVVQNKWNTYFTVNSGGSTMGFMAYVLNNSLFVRGSACPPCRGKTYTLDGNILVCDTCGTTFEAKTGVGISGACVSYPKTSVPYTVSGGDIVMKITDLQTAFQSTLKSGLP